MFSPVVREILDNAENSLILKQRNKKMSQVVGGSREPDFVSWFILGDMIYW
jgi:hypothetical protein